MARTTRPGGEDELDVPELTDADWSLAAATALISAIPFGGHMAVEFMRLVGSPIERRRNEWMTSVAAIVRRLESESLTIESLQGNDQFISAVLQASVIAQRTHLKEKLDALRNALINIAKGQAADEALNTVFLTYVDGFTEWHLKLLRFFQTTPDTRSDFNGEEVLLQSHPELREHPELLDAVVGDLTSKRLIDLGHMGGSSRITGPMLSPKHTTPLGDRFLKFISDPDGVRADPQGSRPAR
jgi:hypothetical protein